MAARPRPTLHAGERSQFCEGIGYKRAIYSSSLVGLRFLMSSNSTSNTRVAPE